MSAMIVPLLFALIIIYALYKRVDVYGAFVKSAVQGLDVLVHVLPYLAAMLIVIELLNSSGLIAILTNVLKLPLGAVGMPPELIPLALLRPFSGSASMALVSDLIAKHGADSFIAAAAATMAGSTETIFYMLAMYFGSVGVEKTRFTLPVALIANFVSIITSILVCGLLYR